MAMDVQVQIESYYEENNIIWYVVELSYEQTSWKVPVRFKQLDILDEVLAQRIWERPVLPSKTLWRKKDPAWLDQRKELVQEYIYQLFMRTDTRNSEEVRYVFKVDQHLPDKSLHTPVVAGKQEMCFNVIDCVKFEGGCFFAMAETNVLGKIDSWFTNIRLPWEKDQGNVQPNGAVSYYRPSSDEWTLVSIWSCTFPEGVTSIHWSESETILSVGRTNGHISLLSIPHPYNRYTVVRNFTTGNSRVVGVGLSDPYVYSVCESKQLLVYPLTQEAEGDPVHYNLADVPKSVTFSQSDKRVIIGLGNGRVTIYDITGEPPSILGTVVTSCESPIIAAQVDFAKGLMFLTHKNGIIDILDRQEGVRRSFTGKGDITAIEIVPGGDEFFTGHASGLVAVWNLDDPCPVYMLTAHKKPVSCLHYVQQSRVLITGSADKTFQVYKLPALWSDELPEISVEHLTSDSSSEDTANS